MAVLFVGEKSLTTVESEQAYINASITALRAPIGGELKLEPLEPGTLITCGTPLFRVENPRFGNLETMSQLNWLQELMDRLRVEIAEAELQHLKEEQAFSITKTLFKEKLISQLDYLREETKVLLFQTAVNQKKEQLRAAEARSLEVEKQLDLQKRADVAMPFDGVIWAAKAQDGQVAAYEPVLQLIDPRHMWVEAFFHEKRAHRFKVGTRVVVRAVDGKETWEGRVESIRAGLDSIMAAWWPRRRESCRAGALRCA